MTGDDGSDFMPEDGRAGRDGLGLLIARVARGDHGAFESVYEQLSGPVYRIILAALRDRAQAEEVAQEVLLEIWRLAFRYDLGKGSAKAWVLTVAAAARSTGSALLRPPPHATCGPPPCGRRTLAAALRQAPPTASSCTRAWAG